MLTERGGRGKEGVVVEEGKEVGGTEREGGQWVAGKGDWVAKWL